MDNFFLPLVKERDEEAARFLGDLDEGIQIADDLADCQIHPRNVELLLCHWFSVFQSIAKSPQLFLKVMFECQLLLNAFQEDLDFVPGRLPKETELAIWMRRGRRAMIGFLVLCEIDPTFDTTQNRHWVEKMGTAGLILNDCGDILSGRFEDFLMMRRNYVALSLFDYSIYHQWRQKTEELEEVARKVQTSIVLPEPPDDRFRPVFELFK